VNILEALDHPALFAPLFPGGTWSTWRVFLAALFGLPMDDADLAVYRHHTGRITPPAVAFQEAALVVGRRGGKSRVLALVATYLATFLSYGPHLAPGEIATVAIIAADRRQARVIFRFIEGALRGVAALSDLVMNVTGEMIELSNRVVIEVHTASFRVTRGYTFAAVLADETAFWRSEDSTNPDVEIFRALRPGLANIPTAMLLNASSPYRKTGVLYQAFARGFGRDDAKILVWHATTLEMNPSLDPSVVEQAYEDDPASAAAEYGAEFRDDINEFVSREIIDACTVRGRVEMLPAAGVLYRAFVDPAGGSGTDSMTLAIAHRQDKACVLDAIREIRPPFSPEAAVSEMSALLKTFRVHDVVGDRYAGEWPREQFRNAGINYRLSDQTKSDLYRDVLPSLNSGNAELLDIKRLASQFCGLERRTARGGRDSIDHGPAGHDDVANAAAGALLLVQQKKGLLMNPEAAARFGPIIPRRIFR
jgi:hypothetical protein